MGAVPGRTVEGIIFDIQRFSVHDGGGIRTLVFLKGCPLRCLWCSNPESQRPSPELMLFPDRCIGCGRCAVACPVEAVVRSGDGKLRTYRDKCRACGVCEDDCPANARARRGRAMTVEQALREVERDSVFYRTSGGGVTLSGGEPLMQPVFSAELLKACHRRGYNTALETCGLAPWQDFALVLEHADTILFDIKHCDSQSHQRLTGSGNEIILANLQRVAGSAAHLIVRVPLVPGCNDDAETVRAIARLAAESGARELHLLPYHRLGESKYLALGRGYPLDGLEPLADEDIARLRRLAEEVSRLVVRLGG